MTFRYQPVAAAKRARSVSLRHRLIRPGEIEALLARAGLTLIASWGSFDGRPLDPADESSEQHVYLARSEHRPQRTTNRTTTKATDRTTKKATTRRVASK